jgi:hypothetical protein
MVWFNSNSAQKTLTIKIKIRIHNWLLLVAIVDGNLEIADYPNHTAETRASSKVHLVCYNDFKSNGSHTKSTIKIKTKVDLYWW